MCALQVRRQLLLVALSVICLLIFAYHWHFHQLFCEGRSYTKALCKQYQRQAIAGHMCEEICVSKTFVLQQCTRNWYGYRVFHQDGFDIKINASVFAENWPNVGKYDTPSLGTSADEFAEMLNKFIAEKLGDGNHNRLTSYLIQFADANRDGKLTLAEAKSLWAIIQHREFLMTLVLQQRQSSVIPRVRGFCGDLVAVDAIPSRELYDLPVPTSSAWYSMFASLLARLYWPDMPTRTSQTASLVEFATQLYNDAQDSIHLCSSDKVNSYRVDESGRVKLAAVGELYSYHEISSWLINRRCTSDIDCQVTTLGCGGLCSANTGRCVVPQSVIGDICNVIFPYLAPGVSPKFAAHVLKEWQREPATRFMRTCLEHLIPNVTSSRTLVEVQVATVNGNLL